MKNLKTKTLQLKKLTITNLNENELLKIAGGSFTTEVNGSSVRCETTALCNSISNQSK